MDDTIYIRSLGEIQARYRAIQTDFSTIAIGPNRTSDLARTHHDMVQLEGDLAALKSPRTLSAVHASWTSILCLMAESLGLFESGRDGIEPMRQAHQEARRCNRIIARLPDELGRMVQQVMSPARQRPDA